MAPSHSSSSGFARAADIIDLVSSEDENDEPSSYATAASGKRNRDPHSSPKNDRAAKKGQTASSKRSAERPSTCMPFINSDVPDNAVCTTDIMPLLHCLKRENIITCSGRNHSTPTTSSLLHIQQLDKWSCGFRNLQVMLTALLPLVPANHKYFFTVPTSLSAYSPQEHRPVPIPSLHQLQTFLEDSWRHGFDERGAKHYSRCIVAKSLEIGAIEVSTILSYLHLDSSVIQFIKVKESRDMLGPFVWQYFSQGPCFACVGGHADDAPSVFGCSTLWAERLLHATTWNASRKNDKFTQTTTALTEDKHMCSCPVLPLYLQWDGHSVCIVGVEKTASGDLDFLLFDPLKNGDILKQTLLSKKKDVLAPMRKSAKTFLKRDVQVIMCSPRQLPPAERDAIRDPYKQGNIVTAAEDKVVRFKQQQQQQQRY